jgi:NAD(P)H-dependent flavin oxidoreductase YrpB (nitropropane dioxygenase family)
MVWVTSAELVAAVSNAGGLGTLGPNAGATSVTDDLEVVGKRLREQIVRTRSLTPRPFAVNVAIGQGNFIKFSDLYVNILIEMKVPVAIVSQGSPRLYIAKLHDAGIKVIHVVATVEQAKKAEAAGVDAIVASGYEGGGHSGWDAICTLPLMPQVANVVKVPLLAGGGIADGRGLIAALALGADGVYMGTRFIATRESPAHETVKRILVEATDNCTASIVHGERKLFSAGRLDTNETWTGDDKVAELRPRGWRRSFKNRYLDQCLNLMDSGASPAELQNYIESPAPNGTNRVLAGLIQGDINDGSIVCGQSAGLIHEIMSAGDVVGTVMRQADELLLRLQQLQGPLEP